MPTRRKASDDRDPDPQGVGFSFRIDALTPTTIPMFRLSEYMTALAQLLGEVEHVHFAKLTPGSLNMNLRVDLEAAPIIRARTETVREATAPVETMRAFRAINKMLRDDSSTGGFRQDGGRSKILFFPGREEILAKPIVVRQRGTIEGQLLRVGGADRTAHLTLQLEDQRQSNCIITRSLGKKIASHLFDFVRVNGTGRWARDENGEWEIIEFKVDGFDLLNNAPLSKAVADLRTLADEWDDKSLLELTQNGAG